MPLQTSNTPPGLYLQLTVSGIPHSFSIKSIIVISSRFIIPPRSLQYLNSPSGVSFDENMISSFLKPSLSAIINSVYDEQSTPQPTSASFLIINGFGVAFTAKYSLNPLFHENASYTFFALSINPFSS